jgi:hypothetical protein
MKSVSRGGSGGGGRQTICFSPAKLPASSRRIKSNLPHVIHIQHVTYAEYGHHRKCCANSDNSLQICELSEQQVPF